MLGSIRTRLLLRQKQGKLRDVLDSIFMRILDVWRRSQIDGQGKVQSTNSEDLQGLRSDVKSFLGLLGDLARKAGRRAVSAKAAEEGEDLEAVDMLRLRIDLNGFYTRREDNAM